jgi:hypothetical protein
MAGLPPYLWDRQSTPSEPGSVHRSPEGISMTQSRGVWKHEDAALILIDYQKEMFETVRSA